MINAEQKNEWEDIGLLVEAVLGLVSIHSNPFWT